MHVHCCLSLCLLWEPSTSAVSTLWDHYSRNLVSAGLQRKQRNDPAVETVGVKQATLRVLFAQSKHLYRSHTTFRLVCSVLLFFMFIASYNVQKKTPYRPLPTPECSVLCALARDVRHGHFAQEPPGSAGAGPQLLLPLWPPLAGTYPALPLGQLLPYIPPSAGPVPRPGRGRGSPAETDQRKVRVDGSTGGFAVLAPSRLLRHGK